MLGLTHRFYNYPARFSPQLVRATIEAFTQPGDLVLDPFCGGATTLVEAAATGREAAGADISPLAVFLARVKTVPLDARSRSRLRSWAEASTELRLRMSVAHPPGYWRERGYQRHLNCPKTWPIRKSIELLLDRVHDLRGRRLRDFARCAVLRTGQWALDGRRNLPPAHRFRDRFRGFVEAMLDGMAEYETARTTRGPHQSDPLCLRCPAKELNRIQQIKKALPPKLVLTSPPYPGVHVLYHRWQIAGRRETPAPFWIAGTLDGSGESHYTMGGRKHHYEETYFESLRASFESIREICDRQTVIVQVVGFSDPAKQLQRYLATLRDVGLDELVPTQAGQSSCRRVWRQVPNRRWYAARRTGVSVGREVVLFHRLSRRGANPRSCPLRLPEGLPEI